MRHKEKDERAGAEAHSGKTFPLINRKTILKQEDLC